ncbi:MAG TPA: helix-turn-helix transcriptional regulator [Bacteroidales bacterium]|nr:helix-turn-helix transcriptional regulator [Bacteroidales bacterium]
METISHEKLVDKYIGKKGTPNRLAYEQELQMDVIAYKIKELRKNRNLTQEELGNLIGKDKTQISKIEKGTRNLTISTILEIMNALNAKFKFRIEINEDIIELT